MNWNALGRGSAAALLLLMLAPLGAGATAMRELREKPHRANPSQIALEKARGLALGFRVVDVTSVEKVRKDREHAGTGNGSKGGGGFVPPADLGGSPAAVPEPSAALLFAGGLLVAGAMRRLRTR